MISNLVSLFSSALVSQTQAAATASSVNSVRAAGSNPFANPFLSNSSPSGSGSNFYGKNNPLKGGYFAGYYNGRPNIVGRRLFIEV